MARGRPAGEAAVPQPDQMGYWLQVREEEERGEDVRGSPNNTSRYEGPLRRHCVREGGDEAKLLSCCTVGSVPVEGADSFR